MTAYKHTTDYHQVATTLTLAQDTTPFYRYLNGPVTDIPQDISYLERRVSQYAAINATIIETAGHGAVAVWELPGGEAVAPKIQSDHSGRTEEIKEHNKKIKSVFEELHSLYDHILDQRDHYHLAFLSKRPDATEKGIVSALVRPFLEKAKEEGKFVRLEAIDYHAVNVYKHWGFKVVKEWVLEEGVPIAFMVFNGEEVF